VLKAASYAERHGLFVGNKATVYIKNGPIGVVGRTGQLTNYLRALERTPDSSMAAPLRAHDADS
jgi:hypothetical protein